MPTYIFYLIVNVKTRISGMLRCHFEQLCIELRVIVPQLVERKFGARLLPVTSEAECARAVRLPNVTDAEWERWYAAPSEGRWRCPLAGGGMSDPRADGELLHASLPERLDASWWRASGQV